MTTDLRRLLELAKKAPFAGANEDFLLRMEGEVREKESLNALADLLLESIAKDKR